MLYMLSFCTYVDSSKCINQWVEKRKDFCLLKLNYSSHDNNFTSTYILCVYKKSFPVLRMSRCVLRHEAQIEVRIHSVYLHITFTFWQGHKVQVRQNKFDQIEPVNVFD